MNKLLAVENGNVHNEVNKTVENEDSRTTCALNSALQTNDLVKLPPKHYTEKLFWRRSGVQFTAEEDEFVKIGITKFRLRWSTILRHPGFTLNACRVPNTLRKRAKALKLV